MSGPTRWAAYILTMCHTSLSWEVCFRMPTSKRLSGALDPEGFDAGFQKEPRPLNAASAGQAVPPTLW